MEVHNKELRTTRELAREVSACLDALSRRELEKIVVTKNGKLIGVLITPDRYDAIIHDADTLRDQLAQQIRA